MSKLKASEGLKMDLYGMMRVKPYANEKEVKKGYRKQALKLHPDKNPNNPNAAKNFQKLQKAFELLLDPVEKGEYDRLLRAKEAAEARRKEQDEKTRAFREKLEQKEREVKRKKEQLDEYHEMERLKRQAEREEDERIMEEERKEKEKRSERQKERQKKEFNVKVRWSKGNHFNQQTLKDIFCKYGGVEEVVVREKARVALLQYHKQLSAIRCLKENEEGGRKLKVELMFEVDYEQANDDDDEDFEEVERHFLNVLHQKSSQSKSPHQQPHQQPHGQTHEQTHGQPHGQPHEQHEYDQQKKEQKSPHYETSHQQHSLRSNQQHHGNHQQQNHGNHQQQHPPRVNRDFESLHDRSLRQAEERKRIIEEMMKNDE